mgnify:CR=1 FL=1
MLSNKEIICPNNLLDVARVRQPSTTYHANSRKIHQMINAKLDQAMRDSFLHLVS